jgi:hypothetical protein
MENFLSRFNGKRVDVYCGGSQACVVMSLRWSQEYCIYVMLKERVAISRSTRSLWFGKHVMTSTVPDLCHPQTEIETTWDCAISNLRIAQELAANLDSKGLR